MIKKEKTTAQIYVKDSDLFWDIKRDKKLESIAEAVEIVTQFYKEKNKK